jgi:adenylate cyclase
LDAENNFTINPDAADTNRTPQQAKIFTLERVWHMGIMLAARQLKLDLANAVVDLEQGRITLRGAAGVERVIPVDRDGFFYVDWTLRPDDPRLTVEPVHNLLRQNRARTLGQPTTPAADWRHKLVVIGSSALGNDLTDLGATPLDKSTLLVSKHWNVANSVITGRFIHPASTGLKIALILLLGVITALITSQLRVMPGLVGVLVLVIAYTLLCLGLYVQQRIWLPMFLPIVAAIGVQYGFQVAYRALFEQREQRRVKGIFSKVVSPNVTKELLGRESLSLSGERAEVTVMFADVRGFTELTDKRQEQVTDYIAQHQLDGKAAEAAHNESARETLHIVNDYLAIVADIVKKHDGTLDKYIGDCVMAFWGAPAAQPDHAVICVRAAIEVQRVIQSFNEKRVEENRQLEIENVARASAGLPPKASFPILSLGTGINTGVVTVGLMGSNDHILNYTIFGREVNLASRLETVSGHGRIVIGEGTYQALLRADAGLAASCVELEPARPKGFQKPVRNFEVRWTEIRT